MVTEEQIVASMRVRQDLFRRGADVNLVEKSIKANIPIVLPTIIASYPWDFAMNIHTDASGTVADQAEYTFRGANEDAFQIAAIWYDDQEDPLKKRTFNQIDAFREHSTISGVTYWVLSRRDGNGYPKITLYDTPSTAGLTLKYRYWRNNITLEELPNQFADVLTEFVSAKLNPLLRGNAMQALAELQSEYDSLSPDSNEVMLDAEIIARNQDISDMQSSF